MLFREPAAFFQPIEGRNELQGAHHAFIVRVWDEKVDDKGYIVVWRGSIEHVRNQERLHFNDFDDMVRFIREAAGIKRGTPASWWRLLLFWLRRKSG